MSGSHHHGVRGGFVERTVAGLHAAINQSLFSEQGALRRGLLQCLDARVKLAGISALILASALASKLWAVAMVLALGGVLAALSFLPLLEIAKRVWFTTLTFSGALAVPALFLTPGRVIYRLPGLDWSITAQGLTTAGFLILRAEAAATLALVLVFTTPWMHVLKALRMLRVPIVFVVILGMTCRYILLLLEAAHEMFESRKSRTVGALTRGEQRRVAILSTGALLSRTVQLSNEVYLAMRSRGFRGEVYILDEFEMANRDWLALATFAALAAALVWLGR